MVSKYPIMVQVMLIRDDGPPQPVEAITDALTDEIDALSIEVDGRDDGEVTVYTLSASVVSVIARERL